jgi:hypothetical protein
MDYNAAEKKQMEKQRFDVFRRCPTNMKNGIQYYHADELLNISREELNRQIKYAFQAPEMELTIKVAKC